MSVAQARQALQAGKRVTSLAALVRVAIEDGRAMLATDENVTPRCDRWLTFDPFEGFQLCHACLAGAVMFRTLGKQLGAYRRMWPSKTEFTPRTFSDVRATALDALNCARAGRWGTAYAFIGRMDVGPEVHDWVDRPAAPMFGDREAFAEHLDSLDGLVAQLDAFEAAYITT